LNRGSDLRGNDLGADHPAAAVRRGDARRATRETDVAVRLCLDGSGEVRADTGLGPLDHLLTALAVHAGFDLEVGAEGDLEVDAHHLVEDVGIVFGRALGRALGDRRGIRRFGWALLPMDESLVEVAVDISGRPRVVDGLDGLQGRCMGALPADVVPEFLWGLATAARLTLHIEVRRAGSVHHVLEALFKGLGRALSQAAAGDPRRGDAVPSSKGVG